MAYAGLINNFGHLEAVEVAQCMLHSRMALRIPVHHGQQPSFKNLKHRIRHRRSSKLITHLVYAGPPKRMQGNVYIENLIQRFFQERMYASGFEVDANYGTLSDSMIDNKIVRVRTANDGTAENQLAVAAVKQTNDVLSQIDDHFYGTVRQS